MEIEEVRKILESKIYRYAKTMPQCPHEYTLKKDWDKSQFEEVVKFIRKNGKIEKYYKKDIIYLYTGNFKYWTMGNPIEQTILINRANVK